MPASFATAMTFFTLRVVLALRGLQVLVGCLDTERERDLVGNDVDVGLTARRDRPRSDIRGNRRRGKQDGDDSENLSTLSQASCRALLSVSIQLPQPCPPNADFSGRR